MELFESRLSTINLIHSGGHQRQSLFVIAPGKVVSYSHFFRSYGGGSVPIIIGDFGGGSGMGN